MEIYIYLYLLSLLFTFIGYGLVYKYIKINDVNRIYGTKYKNKIKNLYIGIFILFLGYLYIFIVNLCSIFVLKYIEAYAIGHVLHIFGFTSICFDGLATWNTYTDTKYDEQYLEKNSVFFKIIIGIFSMIIDSIILINGFWL